MKTLGPTILVAVGLFPGGPASAWAQGEDLEPPVIQHQPQEQAVQGAPLVLRAVIIDASGVFQPAVYVRSVGRHENYLSIAMVQEGAPSHYQATIPASRVEGTLEYFIEAFDEHGNGPARVGRPDAPIRLRAVLPSLAQPSDSPGVQDRVDAPPPTEASVFRQWWFWTLVGAAVVGAAATATVVLLEDGNPDFVTIDVRGGDPAAGL